MAKNPKDELISELNEAARLTGTSKITTSNAALWLRDKFNLLLRGSQHRPLNKKSDISNNKFPKEIESGKLAARLNQRSLGRMMMFVYDPKTKEKLPYYDMFPLVLVVGMKTGGFVGLNLHYVPPLIRMKILEALVANIDRKYLESGFLERNIEAKQILKNYQLLYEASKIPIIKQCFKHYLFGHVRSQFMYIDPPEWSKAVLLPVENFKKASKTKVWNESIANASHKHTTKTATKLSTDTKVKSIFKDG